MHYVWTRIAVLPSAVTKGLEPRTPERIAWDCRFWLDYSSKFYERQTKDVPFTVCLMHHDTYADVLRQFDWPKYVKLVNQECSDWFAENIKPGERVTLTRIDSDDSYSVDFFEYLDSFDFPARVLALHKLQRQYDVLGRRLSQPVYHERPAFATIYYPSFPVIDGDRANGTTLLLAHDPDPTCKTPGVGIAGGPFYGVIGNHGRYPQTPHVTTPGCHVLHRLTGQNPVSRLGVLGWRTVVLKWEECLDPRFVGYGPATD